MIVRAALILGLALAAQAGQAQDAASAPGAILRGLDKVSGQTEEFDLATGASTTFGRLTITLSDCRYPAGDPASNAYAHLTISDTRTGETAFDAWMVASSPALSALDDPRYDVWVLRCRTE
ncbi:MAG: DUF2155 domain-containing protein [Defluviimonas sp.]|uniref:DUF2155 domain-containing protein n=1 Tax=Albidovulum sp. TaxID=1872424 RepID=UPI001DC50FEB|nr:DUF2155 domain-containing protein [Paracoccaceae bacterium]MCC0064336.1 DUF2155 domain-containing protein [Defluviimonas sp.]